MKTQNLSLGFAILLASAYQNDQRKNNQLYYKILIGYLKWKAVSRIILAYL